MRAPLTYVFFLLLISSTCESSTLEDTCKSFAADHQSIGYSYCIKTFHADNASATADARGLAAIAARIAEAAANGTAGRIAALRASEEDARRQERLGVCAEVYSDAVDQLGEAAEDIARGEDKSTQDALTQLSAAMDVRGRVRRGRRHVPAGRGGRRVQEAGDHRPRCRGVPGVAGVGTDRGLVTGVLLC
jgi:pectinesterase inhibitor-like protein